MNQKEIDHLLNEKAVGNSKFANTFKMLGIELLLIFLGGMIAAGLCLIIVGIILFKFD